MQGRRISSYAERPNPMGRHREFTAVLLPDDGICIYWNCTKPIGTRGLCVQHYQELKRDKGRVLTYGKGDYRKPKTKCLTETCTDMGLWCGLCIRCYHRAYKRSKRTAPPGIGRRPIPGADRKVPVVNVRQRRYAAP